jgi:hypothetical protein
MKMDWVGQIGAWCHRAKWECSQFKPALRAPAYSAALASTTDTTEKKDVFMKSLKKTQACKGLEHG